VLGSRSEKSKMPRIKTGEPPTAEERQKTRRERAAAKAQAPTVRVDHKVPDAERRCTACGNAKLDPLGEGKKTSVWEFVPARFLRVEHVQEVLRCRCNGFVVTAPGAPKVVEKGQYGASFLVRIPANLGTRSAGTWALSPAHLGRIGAQRRGSPVGAKRRADGQVLASGRSVPSPFFLRIDVPLSAST
jgi:hypothetical protein